MAKWVKATVRHGHNLSVYLATPAAPYAPAVLMPQEVHGVIRELRDLADRFAAELAQRSPRRIDKKFLRVTLAASLAVCSAISPFI